MGDSLTQARKGGRVRQWDRRIVVPLTEEMVARLDAVRADGQDRLALIRDGIEREVRRRERLARRLGQ